MAIVGVILPYGAHQMPHWPYQPSANALVAIFITILKTAMLVVAAEGVSHLTWAWFTELRPLQDLTMYDAATLSNYYIKTYRGEVRGGTLSERLVWPWGQFADSEQTINAVNVDCLPEKDLRTVAVAGYTINPGAKWLTYNTSIVAAVEARKMLSQTLQTPSSQAFFQKSLYVFSQRSLHTINHWTGNFSQRDMTWKFTSVEGSY